MTTFNVDDQTSAKLAALVGRGHLYKVIRRGGSTLVYEPSKITKAMTNAYLNAAEAVLAQVLSVLTRAALQRRLNALIAFASSQHVLDLSSDRESASRLAMAPDFHGALNPAAP